MSMRWRWPRQSISKPPCTSPSRCMRAPTPTSSSRSTQTCSSTPARMRPSTCSPRLAFEDHGVDAGLRQELPEQQARRARADDRDLGPRDASGRPASAWSRRLHPLAALRVRRRRRRHEREQRARGVRLRARARRPRAEKVVTIWIAGGSGPSTSMPVDVNQLRELLKAELDLAARDERADGNARRRRDDPIADLVGDAPALEQPSRARRRSGRSSTPMVRAASTARRSASSLPISGRGAPARTATATPERARSTALPATRCPAASSLSIASRREHHDVERLAGLHARGGVDAADRLDRDHAARTRLVGARQLGEHGLGRHRRDAADRVGARALSIRHPYMLT